NDASWEQGPGGFGTKGTPGAVVRTTWNSRDIWLRRDFDLPKEKYDDLSFLIHHDEDAEVYINGVVAAKVTGYTTDYVEEEIRSKAFAALKSGKNILAVHCHDKAGGQYIDVGLEKLGD